MNFYDGEEDLKDVIGRYLKLKDAIAVYYLNNSVRFVPNTKENENELRKIMLKQLQERNTNVNLKPFALQKGFDTSLLTVLTCSYIVNYIKYDSVKSYLTICTIFGTIWLSSRIFKNKKVINEVKKSNLFLDMYDKLQSPEGINAVESLYFDKIYSNELNVNTLDDYSYKEVNEVHKKLMKIK